MTNQLDENFLWSPDFEQQLFQLIESLKQLTKINKDFRKQFFQKRLRIK